jgi:pyruvate formate lyase activating enzyme
MRRRDFLQSICVAAGGTLGTGLVACPVWGEDTKYRIEARYYERLPDKAVHCKMCPRQCIVRDGQRGFCRVRQNIDGTYYSIVYGRVCAYHIDPIEKKPLFHFLPGTTAFSLATVGCNMECKFCQNWEISQEKPENVQGISLAPAEVAESAKRFAAPSIAYTYTEPTVFYEYMYDSAAEGHRVGIRSVMISAGYINEEPLRRLATQMDAIKVDLKALSDDFYRDICSTSLKPVLETIGRVKGTGTWLEIVNLIIPTLNDADEDIRRLSRWVLDNVGDEVPIHFTRFYPTYKLKNLPPTPVQSVERARKIAVDMGVKYAYVGNVPAGHPGESTYCPSCGNTVVERAGYTVMAVDLKDGMWDTYPRGMDIAPS